MLKKIESIRKKPVEVRNRYAFWSALGFTAVIAIFWLVSIPSKLTIFTQVSQEEIEVQGGVSRSFSELRASISEGFDTFKQIRKDTSVLEKSVSEDGDDIDFSSFFSTTTIKIEEDTAVVPVKQVLIGTSSKSHIDSPEE